eukprot:TRINITY_DN12840_c0_g1_i4.p1 TRINITY_DN12840_c0_g1~~TRINITY_DN12840_c0_g1_i4.p1  ORF type:complete len:177 (+),score=42.81 TRINITY_DN12840_c0_g1_i4:214-744(+)
MRRNLTNKYPQNCLTLLPGGIAEMFYGAHGEEQIILKKRLGFCKIALQTGASLVPVYAMGTNDVYTRYFSHKSLAAKISSAIQTSLCPWTDRFGIPLGFVPNKVKLVVCVGKPIDVQKIEDREPSREEVAALHEHYCEQLVQLFDRYKERMGPSWVAKKLHFEDEELKIFEKKKGK